MPFSHTRSKLRYAKARLYFAEGNHRNSSPARSPRSPTKRGTGRGLYRQHRRARRLRVPEQPRSRGPSARLRAAPAEGSELQALLPLSCPAGSSPPSSPQEPPQSRLRDHPKFPAVLKGLQGNTLQLSHVSASSISSSYGDFEAHLINLVLH